MLLYVAGAYSAPTPEERDNNVRLASRVAQHLWADGHAVICPHLNTYGFERLNKCWTDGFKMFLVGDFEIISRCDAIVMLPGWENSKGACAEFVFAYWLGIPVYIWPDKPCCADCDCDDE